MTSILLFFICLSATTIGGISGVGGGVIIKPIMDAVSSMPVNQISFLSGCTVLAMTATSMLCSHNSEIRIERERGTMLAIGAALGGIAGKELFERAISIGGNTVSVAQQTLMILLTLGVLFYTIYRTRIAAKNISNKAVCLLIGLLLGLLSSFLGIGGGPINLAVLYYFFSMDSKTAALNSLYIILFSQSASLIYSILGHTVPEIEWSILLIMVVGGVAGGFLGRSISGHLNNKGVDRLFFCLLIVITAVSIYNLIKLLYVFI